MFLISLCPLFQYKTEVFCPFFQDLTIQQLYLYAKKKTTNTTYTTSFSFSVIDRLLPTSL